MAPAARAASGDNWFVMTITAGPDGVSNLSGSWLFDAQSDDGSDSVGFGDGWNIPGFQVSTEYRSLQAGTTEVTTSAGLGGVSHSTGSAFKVSYYPGAAGFSTFSVTGTIAPFASSYLLFYGTGVSLTPIGTPVLHWDKGSATYSVASGSGAHSIALLPPDRDGYAAAAGTDAFGTVSAPFVANGPIVGAFNGTLCGRGVCHFVATSPGGATTSWDVLPATGVGSPSFSGDTPGTWNLTWTGATVQEVPVGSPTLAGYAPVGDHWRDFQP